MKLDGGALNSYDEVLYPATSFPRTHPNRLATVAYLRGMEPAKVNLCRVLELGCGVGTNLIGMACQLPTSEFIGLDLARRPIATGQSYVKELGLENITLHSMDLCQAGSQQFGRFDFIIAHGLYSWVSAPVRERILAICREMLNPQGVAYVSYNAYPGNHLRDLVRGMMRFHTANYEDPVEKVGQARGLLKFLAESAAKPDYYVEAIRAQFERTLKYRDEAFFHDDLSAINQPFYFHEFMSNAGPHGLQFLGEARPNELEPAQFTPQAMERMKELDQAPEVVREQYKDFVRGHGFRETLLCHREIELAPDLLPDRIPNLYASCDAVQKKESQGPHGEIVLFRKPGGSELEATHPGLCAVLESLGSQWPAPVSFEALLATFRAVAAEEHDSADADQREILAQTLAKAYRAGFVELQIFPPAVTNKVSERPSVSKFVRLLLERGESAINQRHVFMKFPDPLGRRLVQLLDGTRDREMLTRDLIEYVRSEHRKLIEKGAPVEEMTEVATILERRVNEGLESLAREGMLES